MKQLKNFKGGNERVNTNNLPPNAINDPRFNEAMQKYGGLNEDELINKLLVSVEMAKKNGTYNPEQMNMYVQMLKNHISPQQFEKLNNIINIINSENA